MPTMFKATILLWLLEESEQNAKVIFQIKLTQIVRNTEVLQEIKYCSEVGGQGKLYFRQKASYQPG